MWLAGLCITSKLTATVATEELSGFQNEVARHHKREYSSTQLVPVRHAGHLLLRGVSFVDVLIYIA
jgi:hypothetical protein